MELHPLTFMMDLTINLMSEPYHKCEVREHYHRDSGLLKNYSCDIVREALIILVDNPSNV